MLKKFDRARYDALLYRDFSVHYGKVNKVVGLTVESVGPPAKLNDLCEIISKDGLTKVMAEVVGFRENKVLLMPYDSVDGIGLGATVRNTEGVLQVPVGEELLGKVLWSLEDTSFSRHLFSIKCSRKRLSDVIIPCSRCFVNESNSQLLTNGN